MADREVVHRKDGGVEVRSKTRRKMTVARKRGVVAAVAAGNTITGAAKLAGVSVQTIIRARKEDTEFDRDLEEAREGFGEHLESEAYKRAVEGVEQDVLIRGKKVGTKKVYDNRLLGQMLEANHKRYKRDDSTKVQVAVVPLTTDQLRAARDLGRENVETLDVLAREFAELEREADEKRQVGSGG